jgi:ankyrin repeat protein
VIVIPIDDPRAVAVTEAIQGGDLEQLRSLLRDHPELVTCAFGLTDASGEPCGMTRAILHVATDWPGHFPSVAETVRVLIDAGADIEARFAGGHHTETALHWAASSDDVEVIDVLLDAGADIEARGAVIGGGTAMSDATAFGQWEAARRLLERGATTTFWEAATLGLRERVDARFAGDEPPSALDVTEAFWGACHGGQLAMAQLLHERGADINWVGWDDITPLDAARRSEATSVVKWLGEAGGRSATEP